MTYPATLKVWNVLSQPRSAWPRSWLRREITFIERDGEDKRCLNSVVRRDSKTLHCQRGRAVSESCRSWEQVK